MTNPILLIVLDGVFAAIVAAGLSLVFNPPRLAIFVTALLGALGHGLRFCLISYTTIDLINATFIASLMIGFLSIFFSRRIHCPAEIISFSSLLPMIPGMYAFKTILSLISFMKTNDKDMLKDILVMIFQNGLITISVVTALVVGVAIPLFIFYEQSFSATRIKK